MRSILKVLAMMPLVTCSLFAWGCEGHELIALIARDHIKPGTIRMIDELLIEYPASPAGNRVCRNQTDNPMALAANWADEAKALEKTADWHFINIPLAARKSGIENEAMLWCPAIKPYIDGGDRAGCILNGISSQLAVLRNARLQPAERAKALRYIINLIGDQTEPLNNSDNHDRSGNCTEVQFLPTESPISLHAAWASEILKKDREREKTSTREYASLVDRAFVSHWPEWGTSSVNLPAWSWDSQQVAATIAYGELYPRVPFAAIDAGSATDAECNTSRKRSEAQHIQISVGYVNRAVPVIRAQLAKAAYHLAEILNQSF